MSGVFEFAGEVDPEQAWEMLAKDPKAALVDVRTSAETTFVGVPDLSELSKDVWFVVLREFPGMTPNSRFVDEIQARLAASGATDLLFLCRSGARSLHAAQTLEGAPVVGGGSVRTWNVKEGFEGDLDGDRHRGGVCGWKSRGLKWVQS